MARRLPSTPPTLPGFTFVRILGSGGFADVFLYEQNLPRRQVAVKVLRSDVVTARVRQMFQAEANLMASLSAHPAILTVLQAGLAADGRPYLVMELCAAGLAATYRRAPLSVPDVLRIGVTIAGALEAAHRAHVLHRDVKPSNILVTAYGHPVLSDFGVAATRLDVAAAQTVGVSVPWTPPEVLADPANATVPSEVYALAATMFSLLAGRSPFEEPEGDNSTQALLRRISRGRRPRRSPELVPPALAAVLDRALSSSVDARPQSAYEFAQELQAVELELGYTPTPLDMAASEWALHSHGDDEDATVLVQQSVPDADPARRRDARRAAGSLAQPGGTRLALGRGVGRRAFFAVLGLCGLLGAALVVSLALLLPAALSSRDIPVVDDLTASVADDVVVFRWSDPGIGADDSYQISVVGHAASTQRSTEFRAALEDRASVCAAVAVVHDGHVGQASAQVCSDDEEER